jgi:hypothetical protein
MKPKSRNDGVVAASEKTVLSPYRATDQFEIRSLVAGVAFVMSIEDLELRTW